MILHMERVERFSAHLMWWGGSYDVTASMRSSHDDGLGFKGRRGPKKFGVRIGYYVDRKVVGWMDWSVISDEFCWNMDSCTVIVKSTPDSLIPLSPSHRKPVYRAY
jgi:hypothetical protein